MQWCVVLNCVVMVTVVFSFLFVVTTVLNGRSFPARNLVEQVDWVIPANQTRSILQLLSLLVVHG